MFMSNETIKCNPCNGTGVYDGVGRFIQEPGICFKCQGKGVQSPADQKRNWGWERNNRARNEALSRMR